MEKTQKTETGKKNDSQVQEQEPSNTQPNRKGGGLRGGPPVILDAPDSNTAKPIKPSPRISLAWAACVRCRTAPLS